MFIVYVYGSTDYSSPEPKDELFQMLTNMRSAVVVFVDGDFNNQLEYLAETDFLSQPIGPTMEIVSSSFVLITNCSWRIPFLPSPHWTEIDHIAIGHRWRGSLVVC